MPLKIKFNMKKLKLEYTVFDITFNVWEIYF